jgi:GDP-L-fucose synthase
MSNFFQGKKVLVTGGTGFVGSHLVEKLIARGANVTVTYRNREKAEKNLQEVLDKVTLVQGDLRGASFCQEVTKGQDIVCHLAADVAGIQYNVAHPATIFRKNLAGFMQILEASRINKVDRFLTTSSACVYTRHCTIPTPESEGFKENPESTNEGYGWAKRMEEFLSKAYKQEFGMKIAVVRPSNMYGPRDNFDPERAHVIPNLLRKIMGGEDPLTVFGTGNPTRAFLYVGDFCDGALLAIEKGTDIGPINIGSDEETKIKELVTTLCKHAGKNPQIIFDTAKPDGQPRRASDITKAKDLLGFKLKISLDEGIQRTIDWYNNEYGQK